MPEGNEIHRLAERQAEVFAGRTVTVDAPNGRFEDGASLLTGRKLRAVDAYGKHLFYDFGRDRQLHIHLGLFGRFREGKMPYPDARGALRLRFSNPASWLELRGPTACDVLGNNARATLLARIGPDPLREDADPALAVNRIHGSRAPLGALLMNQSVISGVGNIYRAELLFRARLSPFLPGRAVTPDQLRKLWRDARDLMKAGMLDRRIVTTRPGDRPHPRGKARRGETHYVYHRQHQPCLVCGTKILSKLFVGRTLYWCPRCQPGEFQPSP